MKEREFVGQKILRHLALKKKILFYIVEVKGFGLNLPTFGFTQLDTKTFFSGWWTSSQKNSFNFLRKF